MKGRLWGIEEREEINGIEGEGGGGGKRRVLEEGAGYKERRTKLKSEQGGSLVGNKGGIPYRNRGEIWCFLILTQGFCMCMRGGSPCIIYNSSWKGKIISLKKTEWLAYIQHFPLSSEITRRSRQNHTKAGTLWNQHRERDHERLGLFLALFSLKLRYYLAALSLRVSVQHLKPRVVQRWPGKAQP